MTTDFNGSPASMPAYQISDLGLMGHAGSAANAINETGDIIGTLGTGTSSEFSPQANHSFLWSNGRITDFGRSYAVFALNNSGQLAGIKYLTDFAADFSPFKVSPVLYESGKWKSILPKGAVSGILAALNDVGQAAGQLWLDASGLSKLPAAVWQGDEVQFLEIPKPYTSAVVKAINNAGEAVGYLQEIISETRYRTSAALWGKNGVTLLGSLPGAEEMSEAVGINSKGSILGVTTYNWDGFSRLSFGAFLWNNGMVTALAKTDDAAPGIDRAKGYVARAINDSNQVVGRAADMGGNPVAFLWQNNAMVNLNTLIPADGGWTLSDAKDLNTQGQIVGQGKYQGHSHAFLLTPIL